LPPKVEGLAMLIGNPMIFRQLPFEMALSKCVVAGYEALELWPPQIAEFRTPELRSRLRTHAHSLGVDLIRLNCADREYFQALRKSEDVAIALAGLKADIDAAADLGMSQLLTWEGRSASFTKEEAFGPVLERTVSLFQQACNYAEDRGVEITVEIHPFTLGINLDWLIQLCDSLADYRFSVTYDCCHFAVGLPDSYIQAIDRLGARVGHVHFSDSDTRSSELHFAPGAGMLDLDGIVQALKRIQFQGTMMLDLWLYPLPEEGTKIGVPFVRRVCEELGLTNRSLTKSFPRMAASRL
jgi:sugar phosphate isomerase/epimerase